MMASRRTKLLFVSAGLLYLLLALWLLKTAFTKGAREPQRNKTILLYHRFSGPLGTLDTWPNIALADIVQGRCPESRCTLVTDRRHLPTADAVLFNVVLLVREFDPSKPRPLDMPRRRRGGGGGGEGQVWVMAQYEPGQSLVNVAGFPFHELDGVFNWTLSWRRDSEARLYSGTWTRRPRPLTDSELESEYPSWQGKVNFGDYFLDRSRDASEQIAPVVWFSSHCATRNMRQLIVKELAQYIGVHTYGHCGPLKCAGPRYLNRNRDIRTEPCFNITNENYLFTVAFESCLCRDQQGHTLWRKWV